MEFDMATMGNAKRRQAERERDLVFIERCYVKGMPYWRIADELARVRRYKLTPQMIALEVKKLHERWRAENTALVEERIQRELAGLDYQEELLHAAFERSIGKVSEVTKDEIPGRRKGSVKLITKIVTKQQNGDVRYLEAIFEVRKQRAQLLGLNKPAKLEVSGNDGGPIEVSTLDQAIAKVYGNHALTPEQQKVLEAAKK